MNTPPFYSPRRQFFRALASDWRLHSLGALYGTIYVVIGFFALHNIGQSQVYNVTWPFIFASGILVFITWRVCAPSARRDTSSYYFNIPQDRVIAFDGRLGFLLLAASWFVLCAFVGTLLKLGGAGITACYRVHPEFVALPFLVMALTVWLVHRPRDKGYWVYAVALPIALFFFSFWRAANLQDNHGNPENAFWPERPDALWLQCVVAGALMALAATLVHAARGAWRRRQIGEIR